MKKLILVLVAIIALFACEEKSKIEIIKNYDSEYHEVTTYKILTQNLIPAETKKQMNLEVNEIFSKTKCEFQSKPENYLYKLFIGQDGEIEKVEVPVSMNESENTSFLNKMNNWKFGKYVEDGKALDYQITITIMKVTRKDGTTFATTIGNEGDLIDEKVFFVAVEEMPSPIGGIAAIQKNITYPEIAKRAGIQGRVYVKAFIDSTGTVVKAEVLKGIGAGCDEVAASAVKKVKFTPGKQRGKAVNVQVTVPILFKLDDTVSEIKKPKAKDEILLKETKDESQNGLAKLSGKLISQDGGLPVVASSIYFEGTKLGCATNEKGEFFISKIPQGEYNLLVSSNSATHNMGKIKMTPDKTEIVELIIATKE